MILGDPSGRLRSGRLQGQATLDTLFRRAAARRPDAIALADPLNRETSTDGPARRLTFAEADHVVSAIAGRLRRMGLRTDAMVGLQFANTTDGVLTLLGVLRAGMIAMPLPLLWRRSEMVAALNRVGATALIVSGRIGRTNHFDLALQVAAETFPIRYVCGYGSNPPDGMVPFDELYDPDELDPVPPLNRDGSSSPGPGAHLAAVTWDVSPAGLVPVARSHAELMAAGLAVQLEARFEQDAVILSTLPPSSFAGLAVTIMPWLQTGGTLVLHHPFDADVFARQCRTTRCSAVIVPGPLVSQFAEAGHLGANGGLRSVVGIWRTPQRLARATPWNDPAVGMIDVQVFGEVGLIAGRRDEDGNPAGIASGPCSAPRGADGEIIVEAQPSTHGTLALRGHMVPCCTFPPGAERTNFPHLEIAADGFVDTGYVCLEDSDTGTLTVTSPPPGLIGIGGCRFGTRALQEVVGQTDSNATIAALPDTLCGHRLAGSATNHAATAKALDESGAHALIVTAFRDRGRPAA